MFPWLLIVIGIAVLLFGNRLPVLGAAVGALLGVVIMRILPGPAELWVQLLIVGGLALLGLLTAGFAKGIIDIVILVLGALAGAGIVLSFLDLFNVDSGILNWILALIGGVLGFILIRRFRSGPKDWGMIILASLMGALLIARGLVILIPSLQGGLLATLIIVALAGAAIAYQSGMFRGKEQAPATAAPAATPVVPPAAKEDTTVPPPSNNP